MYVYIEQIYISEGVMGHDPITVTKHFITCREEFIILASASDLSYHDKPRNSSGMCTGDRREGSRHLAVK